MHKTLIIFLSIVTSLLAYIIYNQNPKIEVSNQGNAEIVIYTKSYCPFCKYAKNLLTKHQVTYREIDITNNKLLQEKLQTTTKHFTVPYIFVKDEFIGGYQDLVNIIEPELTTEKPLEE